jgi:hypothetical protein
MLTLALTAHLVLSAAPAVLTIDVQPAGVEVMVDGKKAGVSGPPIVLKVKAGTHVVRLTFKGDAHEEEVAVKAGEKKTWKWEFEGAKPEASPTDERGAPAE